MRNIIDAIITLIEQSEKILFNDDKKSEVTGYYDLETYVKNIFADTFDYKNDDERKDKMIKTFSYLGSEAYPPDLILKDGDAIEVKTLRQNERVPDAQHDGKVILNSIFPKQTLSLRDYPTLLTKSCIERENWKDEYGNLTEKDIIYAIGIAKERKLKHFCMIYGRNYCASEEIYNSLRHQIKLSLDNLTNSSSSGREFGRIKNFDPLEATLVRVIGQWQIDKPLESI